MFHVFVSLNKVHWYLADRQRAGHGLLNVALQNALIVQSIDNNMLFASNIYVPEIMPGARFDVI
jgi:hypothetical protein